MVRQEKTSTGKHKAKDYLCTEFPRAWKNQPLEVDAEVVFMDALHAIQSMAFDNTYRTDKNGISVTLNENLEVEVKSNQIKTLGSALNVLKKCIGEFFNRKTVRILIVSFDKHDKVPFSKGQTQVKRDDNKVAPEDLEELIFDNDTKIPDNWIDYMSDRDGYRKKY